MDVPPPVPWPRKGEPKRRLGTGGWSKISSESAEMVGKEWEEGGAKQHRGEPQAGEEMGKGQCTPRFNSKAGFAVGTGEPGEPK